MNYWQALSSFFLWSRAIEDKLLEIISFCFRNNDKIDHSTAAWFVATVVLRSSRKPRCLRRTKLKTVPFRSILGKFLDLLFHQEWPSRPSSLYNWIFACAQNLLHSNICNKLRHRIHWKRRKRLNWSCIHCSLSSVYASSRLWSQFFRLQKLWSGNEHKPRDLHRFQRQKEFYLRIYFCLQGRKLVGSKLDNRPNWVRKLGQLFDH